MDRRDRTDRLTAAEVHAKRQDCFLGAFVLGMNAVGVAFGDYALRTAELLNTRATVGLGALATVCGIAAGMELIEASDIKYALKRNK